MGLHLPVWATLGIFFATLVVSLSIAFPVLHSIDARERGLSSAAEESAATAWAHEVTAATSSTIAAAVSLLGYVKSNITFLPRFEDPLSKRTIFFDQNSFARVTTSIRRVYPKVEILGTIPSGVITQSQPPNAFPYYIDLAKSVDYADTITAQVLSGSVSIIVAKLWFHNDSTIVGALVPVYNSSRPSRDQFWGFTAGLFSGRFFNTTTTADVMEASGIHWCLFCIQRTNRTREMIAGTHCSDQDIERAGLVRPLDIVGSCEWKVAVARPYEEVYLTKTHIVLIVIGSILAALFVNLIADHVFVVSRYTPNRTANAPKAHPYFCAIISVCNGEKLWLQAPDDVTLIIEKFSFIVNQACDAHASYVSSPLSPHTFVVTSRDVVNLINACFQILDDASDVTYSHAASAATQHPFMAVAVMIHQCEIGFISFDPSFHFDDGVGGCQPSPSEDSGAEGSLFAVSSLGGSSSKLGIGELDDGTKPTLKLREGGIFQYGGDDVSYTGALFNQWAAPHIIQLSDTAAAQAQGMMGQNPTFFIDYGGINPDSDEVETFVVRGGESKLIRRLLKAEVVPDSNVRTNEGGDESSDFPNDDEGAEEEVASSYQNRQTIARNESEIAQDSVPPDDSEGSLLAHEELNPLVAASRRRIERIQGKKMQPINGASPLRDPMVGLGLEDEMIVVAPTPDRPLAAEVSLPVANKLAACDDEDYDDSNPLTRKAVPRKGVKKESVNKAAAEGDVKTVSVAASLSALIGASGTRDPSDYTRYLSVPPAIDEMLERHYYEHVTMFRVGLDVPFEIVRLRLYIFWRAYEIFFNGFQVNERRNVFQKLRQSMGVRTEEILAQLSVRCVLASMRK